MDTSDKHAWASLTWEEIRQKIATGMDAVIFPIGATEQHGPHLATGMDSSLGSKLCQAVSEATGVPSLPILPYGCSLGHSHRWPGTLALQPQTLISIVSDLGDWLYRAGIRKLFLVNSHVTNAAPLRCALELLRARYDDLSIGLLNTGSLTPRVATAFSADAEDWHANAAETSLMLAIDPASTRPALFEQADDPDRTAACVFSHPVNRTSRNGVTGSPSQASREAGEELFAMLRDDLCEIVRRGLAEKPPLDQSFFEHA